MKVFTGTVERVTPKTAFVTVASTWMHPIYKKAIKQTKTYACHAEKEVLVGSVVTIMECRPLSATKRFKIHEVLKEGTVVALDAKPKVVKKNSKKGTSSKKTNTKKKSK